MNLAVFVHFIDDDSLCVCIFSYHWTI